MLFPPSALPATLTAGKGFTWWGLVFSDLTLLGIGISSIAALFWHQRIAKWVFRADAEEEAARRRLGADGPEPTLIHGVDVGGYELLSSPLVIAAADFANVKHKGQARRTGEPYIAHCVETARILAALLPATGTRAEAAAAAAVLHDVIDDASATREEVAAAFGEEVAALVEGVSKLSNINQARPYIKSRKTE